MAARKCGSSSDSSNVCDELRDMLKMNKEESQFDSFQLMTAVALELHIAFVSQ